MALNPREIDVLDARNGQQTVSTIDAILRESGLVQETGNTIGTNSDEVLSAGLRSYLCIINSSQGDLLGFSFGNLAELYSGGTKTLIPGESFTFQGDFVPSNAIQMVGGGNSTAYTIWWVDKEN